MRCYVYRCARRPETYVYLAERDAFERVPSPLRSQLGGFVLVLELDLHPERRLARADPAVVRANLAEHGFHVQFPPNESLILHGTD